MPIDKLTISQKIADDIINKIMIGHFKPGERLLEENLRQTYESSRSPVREALYLLELQGVVIRIPRKGVYIKTYSKKEIRDLYDAIYDIQSVVLKKGIEEHSPDQINELYEIIKKMDNLIQNKNVKDGFLLIETLQLKLFELSDNKTYIDIYKRLNKSWTIFRYLSLSHPDSLKRSVKEYSNIIEAIEQKNFEKVQINLKEKKNRALSILMELY